MKRIIIDFETKSEIDLFRFGLMRYATDSSTNILMMGWKIIGEKETHIWFPGDDLPYWMVDEEPYHLYAFNAEFEKAIWNNIGTFLYLFPVLKLSQITCIAALANRYSLPNSLEAVSAALGCKQQKNPEGKVLIQVFCTPKHGWPARTDGRWQRFVQYCKDDVLAEEEVLLTLPAQELNEEEREAWEITCEMNQRGIPVDVKSAKQIRIVSEQYREAHYELLPELTGGRITKISQTKRIRDYCNERGLPMEDCTAPTVSEMLTNELPDDVMQLLEMRSQIGLSSIGKYIRFEEMSYNGRIYNNQRYYGALTGRWTGSGVQLYNLPRAKVSAPNIENLYREGLIDKTTYLRNLDSITESEIERFFNWDIVNDNPIKAARALIRPMIKAEPGKVLIWADWASIEYVIIEWLAGNVEGLERFAKMFDQYIDQASAMYAKPYKEVTKTERQSGKVVVLGCGFGQGWQKLKITAKRDWGMELTDEESQFLVSGYRKTHFLVVSMWYTLARACVESVETPGKSVVSHRCSFKTVKDAAGNHWLTIRLPSGRNLFYFRPFIDMGLRGPQVCHYGFSQKIKQWVVMQMIPGRITENIVQATSRCILVNALKKLRNTEVLWTTYDEIICQVDEDKAEAELKRLEDIMCEPLPWAKGLPLRTEGFIMKRYRKM